MLRSLLFGPSLTGIGRFDLALLPLRIFAGLTMAIGHGFKKFPPPAPFVEGVTSMGFAVPEIFAWAAVAAEAGGGLLLAVGLLTRPAALMIAITMATAAFLAHGADPFAKKELALLFFFISMVYILTGSGRTGLDRFLRAK